MKESHDLIIWKFLFYSKLYYFILLANKIICFILAHTMKKKILLSLSIILGLIVSIGSILFQQATKYEEQLEFKNYRTTLLSTRQF